MIPARFQCHLVGSLPEALHMLSEHGEDAKILAGGQSLIPLMRFRLSQPQHLIGINRVPAHLRARAVAGVGSGLRVLRRGDRTASPASRQARLSSQNSA